VNLLVDIGNSRIKWSSRNARGPGRLHAAVYTKENVGACLDAEWHKLKRPGQVWVANVAGKSVAGQLTRWTMAHWHIKPRFAAVSGTSGKIRNAYAEPGRLGVDRWLAMIATWHKYGAAACIVDCGTAVTIDGLDGTGRHLGGLILPGVSMMRQALYQNARGISASPKGRVLQGLAKNTSEGVVTGCTMAIVALIDRSVKTLRKDVIGRLTCVITGGAAREIMPLLAARFVHEPLLVLEGLAVMFEGKL
jgi:type III pantothenate kinase